MHVRAFIDESFHSGEADAGTYLLATVLVRSELEDPVRDGLRRALPGRVARFHWGKDRRETRERALEVMRTSELSGLCMYRANVPARASERARQHALWNLVAELRASGVHDLVFEARERRQNERDQRTLHHIARSQVSAPEFRHAFSRPLDEPLLWLAGYLAGVCGEALRDGGTDRYLRSLPQRLARMSSLPPLP